MKYRVYSPGVVVIKFSDLEVGDYFVFIADIQTAEPSVHRKITPDSYFIISSCKSSCLQETAEVVKMKQDNVIEFIPELKGINKE